MKPLGHKNYGSIPHLIGSKLGPADRHVHEGQHRICTEKTRDKYDVIIVQEKYDGSNVGIAKKDGKIFALTRSGYLAHTSPYEQHHAFSKWVEQYRSLFDTVLNEGERIAGEWLYMAHGLKYKIEEGHPFVAFDLFTPDNQRNIYQEFQYRMPDEIHVPRYLYAAKKAVSIDRAIHFLNSDYYHPILCLDEPEGVVYRVERKGKVDFLAKFVRSNHESGKYFSEKTGNDPVYNCELSDFLNESKI